MSYASAPIPVFILTGFLGSGKTTQLKHWIQQPAYHDSAVIMNELGTVGLDHVLLESSDEQSLMLLDSGCLCCISNNALQDSLETLYFRRLRQEVPAFQRVIIETSGLADPLPLINSLALDHAIRQHYCFAGVITVVDVLHIQQQLTRYAEAGRQLAVADHILLSKTDLAQPASLAEVMRLIQHTHPSASLSYTPAAPLLAFLQAHHHRTPAPLNTSSTAPGQHLAAQAIQHQSFTLHHPLTWARYAAWVQQLQSIGSQLLRLKGIVRFEDGLDYALHAVHHLFAPPQRLQLAVPAAQQGRVFIVTQGLDEAERQNIVDTVTAQHPLAMH